MIRYLWILSVIVLVFAAGCADGVSLPGTLRLGCFANVTHAQALIGAVRGDFAWELKAPVKTQTFNAGPALIEALFAGEIDVAYVGPSPAANAFLRSHGKALRIISGAAANGVSVVAREGSGIKTLADLSGKRIATPQYGNTQDISARHYLTKVLGARLVEAGGDTAIVPVANADQLALFRQGELDAAWAPEPWASRMVHEVHAVRMADEKDLWPARRLSTAVVVVSPAFQDAHPEVVERFLQAHVYITRWINEQPEAAAVIVAEQLEKLTGKALDGRVVREAMRRVEFTTEPLESSIQELVRRSVELRMSPQKADLAGLVDRRSLDRVTLARNEP